MKSLNALAGAIAAAVLCLQFLCSPRSSSRRSCRAALEPAVRRPCRRRIGPALHRRARRLIKVLQPGASTPTVFLDIRTQVARRAASRACSASRSIRSTKQRPVLRLLHARRRRRAGHRRIRGVTGRSERREHDRDGAPDDPASRQHESQRRHARVRARRLSLHRRRRRRRRQRPAEQRAEPQRAARQDPAHRRRYARRRTVRVAADESVLRHDRPGATRSSRSACAIRGASASIAAPASSGCRRRPGRARGSRHADRERRQLRLAGLRRLRLHASTIRRCAIRRLHLPGLRLRRTRAAAARSPAATSIAARRTRCRTAPTSTATSATGEIFAWNGARRPCCSTPR